MTRLFVTLLAFVSLLLTFEAPAADNLQGEIRLQAAHEGAAWVGQEVELNLDLMSTGFSFSGQQFSLPDVAGAYLLPVDSSTVKLSEMRSGQAWQGLRYSFLLYPQREGRLEIPSFEVRFSASSGYGSDPASFRFNTPPVVIEAKLPPGADLHGLLVSTSEFSMNSSWRPQPQAGQALLLKTGDALKLSINRSAANVPGMVFSPLPEFEIDGLRAYYDVPAVKDSINRGKLIGARTDSINFICEREGSFQIPDIRFQWWDPDKEVLNEEVVPGLAFEVLENPAFETADSFDTGGEWNISWQTVTLALAALVLLMFTGRWVFKFSSRWILERRRIMESGEAWAFQQVRAACRKNQAHETYMAITLWLTRCDYLPRGLSLLQLAQRSQTQGLTVEAEKLQKAMVLTTEPNWQGQKLGQLLKDFRSSSRQKPESQHRLAPLNPVL